MPSLDRHAFAAELRDAVRSAGVFDVHEHLVSSRQRAAADPDLFGWIGSSYLWADLVSAGMDRDLLARPDLSREQKWAGLARALPAVRHTGYMEVCRNGWRDLCGMRGRDLDEQNWEEVDAAIREHNRSPTFKREVLSDRCGMARVLVDYQVGGTAVHFYGQREEIDWYQYLLKVRPAKSDRFIAERTIVREMDLACQSRVVKIDSLLYGWLPQTAAENMTLLGCDTSAARSLDAYAELVQDVARRCADEGAVGLKSAHNCCRAPQFRPVDRELAAAAMRQPVSALTPRHIVAFENFVFQEVVRAAGRYRLPLQIHTGTTFGPSGLSSARPGSADRFGDLVQAFPETTFVLMHASWPYWGEIEQMCKRYPNVVLDLAWAIMLSPREAARMLESLLTSVPVGKILWGGDCYFVEESYGSLIQALAVFSRALVHLIEDDVIPQAQAGEVALGVFCTNARAVYRFAS